MTENGLLGRPPVTPSHPDVPAFVRELDIMIRAPTHGLKGQACLAEAKELESSLGTVTGREKTREFYMQEEKAGTTVRRR